MVAGKPQLTTGLSPSELIVTETVAGAWATAEGACQSSIHAASMSPGTGVFLVLTAGPVRGVSVVPGPEFTWRRAVKFMLSMFVVLRG